MNEFFNEGKNASEQQVLNSYEGSELQNKSEESAVYIGYNDDAIISIIKGPYLKNRITIRDLTGRHSWLISQYRALKDVQGYNDEEVVDSNALGLSSGYIEEEKKETELSLKRILDSIKIEDTERLEREIERAEANDTITTLLKELCNYLDEAKNV